MILHWLHSRVAYSFLERHNQQEAPRCERTIRELLGSAVQLTDQWLLFLHSPARNLPQNCE